MTVTQIQDKIVDELDVLKDDIHITSEEDSLTFYLPLDQLEHAEKVLDRELEVLEEHQHEYLVKADL